MFLLFGAFIAGILTVLAPCVLPLLPVIIGGSISGDSKDKRRPILIATSLAISLILFTVLLKATTLLINVPPQAFTYISGGIIVALGLAVLFPFSYANIIGRLGLEHRAQSLLGKGTSNHNAWLGPVIIGAALGPVFSSCSPVYAYILATVLPAHFATAMSYIISYVIGLSLILLAISFYGQRLTRQLRFASNPNGVFQRSLGVLFILVGILILTGSGTKLQVWAANHTPFNFDNFSAKLIPKPTNAIVSTTGDSSLYNVKPSVSAPDFVGIQSWINSKPLSLAQLKGKVVLVDFWTYTCINCIRTLPYVEGWYQEYHNDGLVVVGVEAPEFSYEKIPSNVAAAVKQDSITYPVAIDGNLDTWNAYQNQYWPAEYLIDQNGTIRRADFGEGSYDQMEQAIRGLLATNNTKLPSKLVAPGSASNTVNADQTPETYLGTDRAAAYVGSPQLGSQSTQSYSFANNLSTSQWSLSGQWSVSGTSITAGQNAKLEINVSAQNVYLVGGAISPANVTVQFNGKPISQTGDAGANVKNSQVTMQLSNLYRIASFPSFTSGIITLDVPAGVSINTFTFGNNYQ
jgi:cytochrome c biogenesis protein CcdA/thiol-disulfide isomerase/thioredoxin